MNLQPVIHITWPSGEETVDNIKVAINNTANFGMKEAGFWYYNLHDEFIIIHPMNVKKIRISHKQVK